MWDGESAKFWLHVLTELRNRGGQRHFFVVCDGLKGLPDSVATAFPLAIVHTSSVHYGGGGRVPSITRAVSVRTCSTCCLRGPDADMSGRGTVQITVYGPA